MCTYGSSFQITLYITDFLILGYLRQHFPRLWVPIEVALVQRARWVPGYELTGALAQRPEYLELEDGAHEVPVIKISFC